jgi:hypothetical protein
MKMTSNGGAQPTPNLSQAGMQKIQNYMKFLQSENKSVDE